jgi:hypothetical protein
MLAVEELVELFEATLDDDDDDDDEFEEEEVDALELDEEVVAPSDLLALRVTP